MSTQSKFMIFVLCLFLTSPLFAIPNIANCPNGYVAYATGFISIADVEFENAPYPHSVSRAETSATSRCYGKWSSALSYANAGCKSTAQLNAAGTGYNYTCWKCSGAVGPGIAYYDDVHVLQASDLAVSAFPGVVVNVKTVDEEFEGSVREIHVVSVSNGDVGSEFVQDVRVDLATQEVTVTEMAPEEGSCN